MRPPAANRAQRPQSTDRILIDRLSQETYKLYEFPNSQKLVSKSEKGTLSDVTPRPSTTTPGSDKTLRKNKSAQKPNTTLNGPRKGRFLLTTQIMFVIENVKSPVKINQLPYCDAAFD